MPPPPPPPHVTRDSRVSFSLLPAYRSSIAVCPTDGDAGREVFVLLPVAVLLDGLLQEADAFRLRAAQRGLSPDGVRLS